ncbi:MAG: lactate utilization protein [Elusimicrobia bacterium]|nr:lactate utilization protein [Candidatus Liberimonas magnetica]
MDENIKWHNLIVLNEVAKKLEKNNFKVIVAEGAETARKKVLEIIDAKESVGIGGSMTIEELNIIEELRKRGQNIIRHTPGMPLDESLDIRRKALTSDVYVASPNAITKDGTLMLCDGVGNRVSAMIFGPKKVIAVAGINKIVSDESAGWCRIDEIAAPSNAKRLNLNNPCVAKGKCVECDLPSRICNIGVVLWKKPKQTEYYVVLVNENLGY